MNKEILEKIASMFIDSKLGVLKHFQEKPESGDLQTILAYEKTKKALAAKERMAYTLLDVNNDLELVCRLNQAIHQIKQLNFKLKQQIDCFRIIEIEITIAGEEAKEQMLRELINFNKEVMI